MADLLAGRYRLEELLGRGGMGWVQRAVDEASGRQVAVKFLRAEGQPDRLATAFLWEVGAVARLDHPGIVPLYDFGRTDEKQPYIVMGLSPGTPLTQIAHAAVSWPSFCAIFERILQILAHSHARGVFHHDLKPGNVLLCVDGAGVVRVQVIDFGIAGVLGQQAGGQDLGPTALVGTASYLAPESVRAYQLYRFSPSPDLYAVGIMAYELAYGQRPFVADDVRHVLRMHQKDEPPARPFRGVFRAPEQLHLWIRKMLAKDPRERFGSATEALAILRQLAPSEALGGRHRTDALPGPRFGLSGDELAPSLVDSPRDHFKLLSVRPPPFAGRRPESRFLSTRLADTAMRRHAQVVLLTGPPGVGKSRLVRQIGEWAAEHGRANVAVAPYSLSGSDSVEGWRAILLALLGYAGATRDLLATRLGEDLKWLDLSGQIDPEVVLDLLFPAEEPNGGEGVERAAEFDWVGTYLRLLTSLAQKRPTLVILEDLQAADDARGIEVLEFLLRSAESGPVVVILTMESPGLGEPGVAESEIHRLERYPSFVTNRLSALNGDEIQAMIERLIPLDDRLRRQVIKAAKGFPIYAVELLRFWVRMRALAAEDGRYSLVKGARTLPESVTEIWKARLEVLARTGQHGRARVELLERAAVLGEPFTYAGLREVVESEGRQDLIELIGEAWSAWHAEGLCQQIAPGRSVFAHPTLAAATLAGTEPASLRAIHRYCALAHLRTPMMAPGAGVLAVARHYAEAGLPQEAFPFYVRAAREAHHAGRYLAAVTHCRRTAELLVASGANALDRRWAVVYRLLAEALLRLSHYEDVEEIALRLEERARRWKDTLHLAIALRLLATARWRRGRSEEAQQNLMEARRLFESLGVHRELGHCDLTLGELWGERRAPGEIRERFRQARRHFANVRDSRGTAQALVSEAKLLRDVGELRKAEQFLSDAHAIFKRLADRSGMADVTRQRGRVALIEERHGPALDTFAEASQIYRAIGDREGLALCVLETGRAYRALARLSEAEQHFRKAREEFVALGNRKRSIQAHLGLVQLAVDSGHFVSSVPHLEQVLAEVRGGSDLRTEMIAEAFTARCVAEQDLWPEADAALCRAAEILQRLKLVDTDVARQMECVARRALGGGQTVIANTAIAASRGIWERIKRPDQVRRLRSMGAAR